MVTKNVKNLITLITKQYIYAQRCLKRPLNFCELKTKILNQKNVELYIAKKNNQLVKHLAKWGE